MTENNTNNKNIKICQICNTINKSNYKDFCQKCYNHNLKKTRQSLAPKILCECGCGESIPSIDYDGNPMRFKIGHMSRGHNNPRWHGGWRIKMGYKEIWTPTHPNCDVDGYVMEHRLVMEQHLGRYLTDQEQIHHRDKNKLNNNILNLKLVTPQEHRKIHGPERRKDMSDRVCKLCVTKDTVRSKKDNRPDWFTYKNGFICNKCSCKLRYIERQIRKWLF